MACDAKETSVLSDEIAKPDRRVLLALAALGCLAPRAARAATPEEDQELQLFAASASRLKPKEALDVRSQDAYVLSAAAAGVLIDRLPMPELKPAGAYAPGVETGRIGRFGPCTIIRYRVAPGAGLPAHNHPNFSVVTIGLSGEAAYEQFEPAGPAPAFTSADPFKIRKVGDRSLIRGGVLTLAPQRDNIHAFTAGRDGAEFFDIISLHTKDEGFGNMRLKHPLRLGEVGEARWLKT
jgi:hypothetical protein